MFDAPRALDVAMATGVEKEHKKAASFLLLLFITTARGLCGGVGQLLGFVPVFGLGQGRRRGVAHHHHHLRTCYSAIRFRLRLASFTASGPVRQRLGFGWLNLQLVRPYTRQLPCVAHNLWRAKSVVSVFAFSLGID